MTRDRPNKHIARYSMIYLIYSTMIGMTMKQPFLCCRAEDVPFTCLFVLYQIQMFNITDGLPLVVRVSFV